MLCHLGNITCRTNSTLKCDRKTGHILGNKEASTLWGRVYRKGWEPKVQYCFGFPDRERLESRLRTLGGSRGPRVSGYSSSHWNASLD
ncbi:MAG: Gfo/Idh/MocA family oxidoreductase [Armatimonadetes bacterium]|jgi:hypothetical protein|nr:Gfo/Idh/MocA family oxidoreductase [Armatimonadota bacterium]